MTNVQKKVLKYSLSVLGALIAVVFLCALWLYTGQLTSAKVAVFKVIPYPMALVNGQPILMKDFLLRYEVSKKISGSDVIDQNATLAKTQIYNKLIDETRVAQVASKHNVSVNQKEIEREYQNRSVQTDLQGKKNFDELVTSFGLTPSQYKAQSIEPDLLQNNLTVWFNSQPSLNKNAFDQADSIVQRIHNGESMVILAVGLTQEETEKGTGGDMGFVDPSQLLPELIDPVSSMNLGEVKIIPSRYGLHIIREEEKQGNRLHLREIFIKTGDFAAWFANETKNFSINKLVKVN